MDWVKSTAWGSGTNPSTPLSLHCLSLRTVAAWYYFLLYSWWPAIMPYVAKGLFTWHMLFLGRLLKWLILISFCRSSFIDVEVVLKLLLLFKYPAVSLNYVVTKPKYTWKAIYDSLFVLVHQKTPKKLHLAPHNQKVVYERSWPPASKCALL